MGIQYIGSRASKTIVGNFMPDGSGMQSPTGNFYPFVAFVKSFDNEEENIEKSGELN